MPIVSLDDFLKVNTAPAHFVADIHLPPDIRIKKVMPKRPIDLSILEGRGFKLDVGHEDKKWTLKDRGVGRALLIDEQGKPTGYEVCSHFSRGAKPDFWYEVEPVRIYT